jgi:hypothetical protein
VCLLLLRLTNVGSAVTPSSTWLIVVVLGLVVWVLYFVHGSIAYVVKGSVRGRVIQAICISGSIAIFVAQIALLDHFVPSWGDGMGLGGFILIEVGGALVLLFYGLLRARKRALKP